MGEEGVGEEEGDLELSKGNPTGLRAALTWAISVKTTTGEAALLANLGEGVAGLFKEARGERGEDVGEGGSLVMKLVKVEVT